jgi:hypothetical protein
VTFSAFLLAASLATGAPPSPQIPPQARPVRVEVTARAVVTIISAEPVDIAESKGKPDRQRRLRDGISLIEFY